MTAEHDGMITRTEAVERMLEARKTLLADRRTEIVSIAEITGRVLAESITAQEDRPSRSYATMDGFAFDASNPYPLAIREEPVFPEDEPLPLASGEAVRIATGAPLPENANAVLKREESTTDDEGLKGPSITPGTYTYERASNVRANETLYAPGDRLAAKDALLLGDLGMTEVEVYAPFSTALLATGTELHEGRIPDLDSPMLEGLIRSWGHEVSYAGTVPDEYERVVDRISELADDHDIIVTTGGTSVGKKDYVIRALSEIGTVVFHRVAIRPGKPIALAQLSDHDAVAVAVPGKPVGAYTIATLVARTLFSGDFLLPTVPVPLARDVGIGATGFEYVVPVELDGNEAMPLGHVDSSLAIYEGAFDPSVLSSSTRAARADGFIITEEHLTGGDVVDVVPADVIE